MFTVYIYIYIQHSCHAQKRVNNTCIYVNWILHLRISEHIILFFYLISAY